MPIFAPLLLTRIRTRRDPRLTPVDTLVTLLIAPSRPRSGVDADREAAEQRR